jgi:hypothetical protein
LPFHVEKGSVHNSTETKPLLINEVSGDKRNPSGYQRLACSFRHYILATNKPLESVWTGVSVSRSSKSPCWKIHLPAIRQEIVTTEPLPLWVPSEAAGAACRVSPLRLLLDPLTFQTSFKFLHSTATRPAPSTFPYLPAARSYLPLRLSEMNWR